MERLLRISGAINTVLQRIAMASGVLFLLCTAVITLDVVSRKFGFQIPNMGSTRLQELEWQIHTALFSFWLGVGYVQHAHVRIDVAVANATSRVRAIIELLGCVLFALPFCAIALYFSMDFTWTAYLHNEDRHRPMVCHGCGFRRASSPRD